MKKYIYKIKLVIITAFVLTSCAVDDDATVTTFAGNIEASFSARVYRTTATATSYDLVVNLSSALTNSAQLDYTLDGTTLVARGDQDSNTITITVDMSGRTFRTVSLTRIIMFYASAQNTNMTVSATNNTATIVRGDDTIAQMTWGNTTDIDLLLTAAPAPTAPYVDDPATTIDLSLSVNPVETVILPATSADGDYSVSIVPFAAFTTPIQFSLSVFAGTTAYSFTGTVASGEAATGGFFSPISYSTVVEFARITKSGTTYTVVNQL